MITSITYGTFALDSTNGVSVNVIREKSLPEKAIALLQPARERGLDILSVVNKSKVIEIEGTISSTGEATYQSDIRDFVAALDDQADLTIVATDGSFKYEDCIILNPEAILQSESHYNINFMPFRVTLLASDGVAVSSNTTFNAWDNIASSPYTNAVTINGTAVAEPTITLTLDSSGGNNITGLAFINRDTNESITISTAYASDDVVIINTKTKQTTYNTQVKTFSGIFPSFNMGRNRWRATVTTGDTVHQQQVSSDGDRSVYGANYLSQQVQPSANLTVPQIDLNIKKIDFTPSGAAEVLVVAGGGPGGGGDGDQKGGGAGGAGGYLYEAAKTITEKAYTVTVGTGGTGIFGQGSNGADSVFDTITSTGGGAGGFGDLLPGKNGGSGGGGSGRTGGTAGGTGTSGQGNNGGNGQSTEGGGGGGASGAGGTGTSGGGTQGAGTANSISGASVTYSVGGKGGGAGTGTNTTTDTPGSGGGGAHRDGGNQAGASGKNGIVIIRYATDGSDGISTSSTGGTITTSGSDTIHTFTSSGTFTAVLTTQVANTDLQVEIQTDNAGVPSGTAVTNGTTTILTSDVGSSFSVIPATFATEPSLTSGTDYHIVLKQTGGDAENYYSVKTNTAGGYALGNIQTSSNSGSTWTEQTDDMYFTLYTSFPTGFNLDIDIDYRVTHHSVA